MSLVSMFRCKQCGVRMFERDCVGHLGRHGVDTKKLTQERILAHFDEQPREQTARPGDGLKPMHYGKGKKKVVPAIEAEEETLN